MTPKGLIRRKRNQPTNQPTNQFFVEGKLEMVHYEPGSQSNWKFMVELKNGPWEGFIHESISIDCHSGKLEPLWLKIVYLDEWNPFLKELRLL